MNAKESQPEHLGPYRIETVLGRGGMGTVYAGSHVRTGERVAVKVIAESIANHERFRRRFDAEVETLKRLSHKHIVRLIGYGEEAGRLFYSMEYVEGESLHQQLRSQQRLDWQTTLKIAIQIASALKHAHDIGVIHRDLKPANLMIDSSGNLKITDFGIAKLYGGTDETVMGSVMGTADFMPPEQAEGLRVTAKSDLYALGAVMYTCLTGDSPHAASTVPEALYNARYKQPPSMTQLGCNVPAPLDELVMELLRKDPKERPATAFVVFNRLAAMQAGFQRVGQPPLLLSDADETELQDLPPDATSDKSRLPSQYTADMPGETGGAPTAGRSGVDITLASDKLIAKSHRNQTTGAAQGLIQDGPTAPQPEAIQKPRSHFTSVDEERRLLTDEEVETGDQQFRNLSVLGLSLLLVACLAGIWYALSPPTADDLYAAATAAIDGDEAPATTLAAVDRFAAAYPEDPRLEDLQPIADEIRARAKAEDLKNSPRKAVKDDPLEIALATALEPAGRDPELAAKRLRSLLEVFADDSLLDERERRLRRVAEEELERIEEKLADGPAAVDEFLAPQFEAAARKSPSARAAFYRSVIELYSGVPTARKAVEQARRLLESLPSIED